MRKLLGTLAAVMLLVGCYTEDDYTGNPEGPKVAIVGDGDMETVAAGLHAALDGDYRVRVAGHERTTYDNAAVIQEFLDVAVSDAGMVFGEDVPDVFVLMPSWLDVHQNDRDPFEFYGFTGDLDPTPIGVRAITTTAGICYVFGTLTYDRADVDEANDLLRSPGFAAAYPDVVLADWDAEVDAHPGYQNNEGGVTVSGEAALVATIDAAVRSCP